MFRRLVSVVVALTLLAVLALFSTPENTYSKQAEQEPSTEVITSKSESTIAVKESCETEHNKIDVTKDDKKVEKKQEPAKWSGKRLTPQLGTVQGPSGKETYYNLPMGKVVKLMRNLGYNYEYHVREDGVKMFGKYIMCAANLKLHPRGSLVETSLGTAIVCDTGSFAHKNKNQIDIAVTW